MYLPTVQRAVSIYSKTHLRFVGKISVMRQSNAALPQEMTELKTADTIKLWYLLYTKYKDAAQTPEVNVLNTENKSIWLYNRGYS